MGFVSSKRPRGSAPYVFRNSSEAQGSSPVAYPAGWADKDLLVLATITDSSGGLATPSGFTLVRIDQIGTASFMGTWTRIAQTGDTPSVAHGGVSSAILAYVGQRQPAVDTHNGVATGGVSATTTDTPSVTPSRAGLLLSLWGINLQNGSFGAPPAGMTSRVSLTSTSTRRVAFAIAEQPVPANTATGTRTITHTQTTNRIAQSLVI